MTKSAKPGTDVSPERSAQMARIKGRDTGPEMCVRRALHSAGLRFRLHDRRLPGTPDIILPSRGIAIFVHGCFWHRHPDPSCKLARLPKTRLDFWIPKLEANRHRDLRHEAALRASGWEVRTIWECALSCEGALEHFVAACGHAPLSCRRQRESRSVRPCDECSARFDLAGHFTCPQ